MPALLRHLRQFFRRLGRLALAARVICQDKNKVRIHKTDLAEYQKPRFSSAEIGVSFVKMFIRIAVMLKM